MGLRGSLRGSCNFVCRVAHTQLVACLRHLPPSACRPTHTKMRRARQAACCAQRAPAPMTPATRSATLASPAPMPPQQVCTACSLLPSPPSLPLLSVSRRLSSSGLRLSRLLLLLTVLEPPRMLLLLPLQRRRVSPRHRAPMSTPQAPQDTLSGESIGLHQASV